jgi:hypothetical protein
MISKFQYKLVKLDKRHRGNEVFTHRVKIVPVYDYKVSDDAVSREMMFCEARLWLWEQFGSSCEIWFYNRSSNQDYGKHCNRDWSWERSDEDLRLYLSDKAASSFSLVWL